MPVLAGLDVRSFAAPHPRLAEDYLRRQEALGCIRPEWRFAWVDRTGTILARVVYWGVAGSAAPCLVDVAIGDDERATSELLAVSLDRLAIGAIDYQATRALGAGRGGDEPPALEACGFTLVATQQRLIHRGPSPPLPERRGIELRTAGEVGDDALVPIVTAVRGATADRVTRGRIDSAAELAGLRAVAHDPAWWTVAVDAGRPIGFVLPVRTDGGPVIADIGVVPAARGRGIGRLLLAHGTAAVLGETGRVGADVDEENAAMLATAATVGYTAFAARAHYVRRMSGGQ